MARGSSVTDRGGKAGLPALVILALAGPGLLPAPGAAEEPSKAQLPPRSDAQPPPRAPAQPPPRPSMGRSRRSALDARVATLARALALDAKQQAELRKVLLDQRAQLLTIWGDQTLPSGSRVAMTREVSRRTADRIRSLLTEEQRKRYNPPPADEGNTVRDARVEDWMKRGANEAKVPPAATSEAGSSEAKGSASSDAKEGAQGGKGGDDARPE